MFGCYKRNANLFYAIKVIFSYLLLEFCNMSTHSYT
jgi:hypothetical protein